MSNFRCWMMVNSSLLARGVAGAKLKRWKVSSTIGTIAKQQEALIKTDLMKGTIKSEHVQGPMSLRCSD